MGYIPLEEREKLFKEALDESYRLWRSKDNENAFRAVRKATLYLPDFTDQFNYLYDLMKIKDRSAVICASDKTPNYESYLIFSLESHALEIARDLVAFPHLAGFYYRKKIKYSPYSYNPNDDFEISDDDENMDIALKKLNLYKYRKEIFNEYNKFIYEELPIIYGIFPKYNEESLNRIIENSLKYREEFDELLFRFVPELQNKSIDYMPYEIYSFIIKLLKKYYDMGKQ